MKEIFEKIKERLKELGWVFAEYYPDGTEVNKRTRKSVAYDDVVEIVNQVAEEYNDKYVSIGVYKQVAWERDIAIEQLHELGYEFGQKIEEEFCEWIKYDYRTIAPKNHDIGNPYWRIPEDMSKLRFCPYCGKKIKVVE